MWFTGKRILNLIHQMTGFSADPQFIQCHPLTHDVWFLKSKDWRTRNPHLEALKTRLHKSVHPRCFFLAWLFSMSVLATIMNLTLFMNCQTRHSRNTWIVIDHIYRSNVSMSNLVYLTLLKWFLTHCDLGCYSTTSSILINLIPDILPFLISQVKTPQKGQQDFLIFCGSAVLLVTWLHIFVANRVELVRQAALVDVRLFLASVCDF